MYSNVTADNLDAAVPQIDSAEYALYIKSVLKMLVGELCVLEWAEKGELKLTSSCVHAAVPMMYQSL